VLSVNEHPPCRELSHLEIAPQLLPPPPSSGWGLESGATLAGGRDGTVDALTAAMPFDEHVDTVVALCDPNGDGFIGVRDLQRVADALHDNRDAIGATWVAGSRSPPPHSLTSTGDRPGEPLSASADAVAAAVHPKYAVAAADVATVTRRGYRTVGGVEGIPAAPAYTMDDIRAREGHSDTLLRLCVCVHTPASASACT